MHVLSERWHDSRLFTFHLEVTGQLVNLQVPQKVIFLRTHLHASFHRGGLQHIWHPPTGPP